MLNINIRKLTKYFVLLLFIAVPSLFTVQKVHAGVAIGGQVIDIGHINIDALEIDQDEWNNKVKDDVKNLLQNVGSLQNLIDGQSKGMYTDDELDSKFNYKHFYGNSKCESRIDDEDTNDKYLNISKLALVLLKVEIGGKCYEVFDDGHDITDIQKSLENKENFEIIFEWVTSNTIKRVDSHGGDYGITDPNTPSLSNRFFRLDGDGDYVDVASTDRGYYYAEGDVFYDILIEHQLGGWGPRPEGQVFAAAVRIGKVENKALPPSDINPNGTAGNTEPICDAGPGLTVIVCNIIGFIQGIVEWVSNSVIIPFLKTAPLAPTDGDTAYEIWKNIKTLANVLLVPVFFVIIFSQALSLNIDAYTVKKILPKLVIATILIQFSFYFVTILVDITNIIGNGIGDLVTTPIRDQAIQFNFRDDGASSAFVIGATITAVVAGIGAILTGAIFLVLIPLLFAMMGVFFTLIFRQILIILLAILAPIAFVAWILPNTERLYKIWQEFLIKALMMYPLIVLLLASGSIVATIASEIGSGIDAPGGGAIATQGAATVGDIIAVAAMVVPLALIPATFKFAGTAVAAIGGGLQRLSGRVQGGKDGKGGLIGRLRGGVETRKREFGAGARGRLGQTFVKPSASLGRNRALQRVPLLGKALGNSNARAVAAFNESREAAEKDLEAKGFSDGRALTEFAAHGDSMHSFNQRLATLRNGTESDRQTAAQLEKMRHMVGNRAYQSAALTRAAKFGQADAAGFQGVHRALRGDRALQASAIGSATFATRERNMLQSGWRVNSNGNLEYSEEQVAQNLLSATPDILAKQRDYAAQDFTIPGTGQRAMGMQTHLERLHGQTAIVPDGQGGGTRLVTEAESRAFTGKLESARGPMGQLSASNAVAVENVLGPAEPQVQQVDVRAVGGERVENVDSDITGSGAIPVRETGGTSPASPAPTTPPPTIVIPGLPGGGPRPPGSGPTGGTTPPKTTPSPSSPAPSSPKSPPLRTPLTGDMQQMVDDMRRAGAIPPEDEGN